MNDVGKDDCYNLKKCIYGLVQAAKQYKKKTAENLKKERFTGGNVEPFLYMKKAIKE